MSCRPEAAHDAGRGSMYLVGSANGGSLAANNVVHDDKRLELTTLERLADNYFLFVNEKLRGAAFRATDYGEQAVHLFAGDQA